MLDHVVQIFREMGGVEYFHGVLFKSSHRTCTKEYIKRTQRKTTAVKETLRNQDCKRIFEHSVMLHSENIVCVDNKRSSLH